MPEMTYIKAFPAFADPIFLSGEVKLSIAY
jgi:hypothetical protein